MPFLRSLSGFRRFEESVPPVLQETSVSEDGRKTLHRHGVTSQQTTDLCEHPKTRDVCQVTHCHVDGWPALQTGRFQLSAAHKLLSGDDSSYLRWTSGLMTDGQTEHLHSLTVRLHTAQWRWWWSAGTDETSTTSEYTVNVKCMFGTKKLYSTRNRHINVKIKLNQEQTTKAQRGSRGTAVHFL